MNLAAMSWETLGSAGGTVVAVVLILGNVILKVAARRNPQPQCPIPEHVQSLATLEEHKLATGRTLQRLDTTTAATLDKVSELGKEVAGLKGSIEQSLSRSPRK